MDRDAVTGLLNDLAATLDNDGSLEHLTRSAVRLATAAELDDFRTVFEIHLAGHPTLESAKQRGFSITARDDLRGHSVWNPHEAVLQDRQVSDTHITALSAREIDFAMDNLRRSVNSMVVTSRTKPHLVNLVLPKDRATLEAYKAIVDRIRVRAQLLDTAVRAKLQPKSDAGQSELDQKFGILRSVPQARRDVADWWSDGLALIFFDIDHFKSINSRFTESVVDECILIPFQRKIYSLLEHRGAAYLVGGDEYVAVLRNVDAKEASQFAERLRSTVASARFLVNGATQQVTLSIGVAMCPLHGKTYDTLLKVANLAERRAKELGRDRVVVAEMPSATLGDGDRGQ